MYLHLNLVLCPELLALQMFPQQELPALTDHPTFWLLLLFIPSGQAIPLLACGSSLNDNHLTFASKGALQTLALSPGYLCGTLGIIYPAPTLAVCPRYCFRMHKALSDLLHSFSCLCKTEEQGSHPGPRRGGYPRGLAAPTTPYGCLQAWDTTAQPQP